MLTFALCVPLSGVCKLREQIYAIVQKMVERRRDPKGTREEQIEAAEQDMKEVRRTSYYRFNTPSLITWFINVSVIL